MHSLIKELHCSFKSMGDAEVKTAQENYLLNKFTCYGMKKGTFREISKHVLVEVLTWEKSEIVDFIYECYEQKQREFHYLAIDIVNKYLKQWNISDLDLCIYLITHNSWWDTCDEIAQKMMLKIFEDDRKPLISLSKNKHEWVRRCAIITQNKSRVNCDYAVLTETIKNNYENKWWFMQKAIGWALRERTGYNNKYILDTVKTFKLDGLAKREAIRNI